MDLSAWQECLEVHFTRLRGQRPSGRPIFALEHGLRSEEVADLQGEIRKHVLELPPSNAHSMVWLIYASEFGYLYFGDEYWQTFEEQTPGWTQHGARGWIRESFKTFADRFGGAQPTGAWAQHFSIICWPITHAILPRDLQRQLARLLYELRGTLRPEFFESPELLGAHINSHSYRATRRFQYFAQEPRLVGQIALALLLQGREFTEPLILRSTLQRITADLDRERQAREWLKSAQRSAEQERLKGLKATASVKVHGDVPTQERQRVVSLGIEPRIVLRASGANSWQVLLRIPDLSPLLDQFPEFRSVFMESRCQVAGSDGRPLARGRLLFGDQQILLRRWPDDNEILVKFDKSEPALDALLRASTMLSRGPVWLFKVAKDGFAYPVLSKVVRSNQSYLIFKAQDSFPGPLAGSQPIIECEGIRVRRIDVPSALDRQFEEMLKGLGLGQVRSIHVWPAGLPAAAWDGEGDSEWLTIDRPRVGIKVDHEIEEISLRLDTDPPQSLNISPANSDAFFVELPQLPKGVHILEVSAHAKPSWPGALDGYLLLRIRDPRSWKQYGLSDRNPIHLTIDPPTPTLEELWSGALTLELSGPKGNRVSCEITLLGRPHEALVQKKLPSFQLPLSPSAWKAYFEKYVQGDSSVQDQIDTARVCEVRFNAVELGQILIRCEREFSPVRWVVRRVGTDEYVLELRDDSGLDRPVSVARYAFSTPGEARVQELPDPSLTFRAPEAGGLFLAVQEAYRQAVIVPPNKIRQLHDLRAVPEIPRAARDVDSLVRMIDLFDLWSAARCAGNIVSFIQRRDVLEALQREIMHAVAGRPWAEAETRLRKSLPDRLLEFIPLIPERAHERDFALSLGREFKNVTNVPIPERINWLATLGRTRVHVPWFRPKVFQFLKTSESARIHTESAPDPPENAEWLVEYALRLMSAPGGLRSWARDWFAEGLRRVLNLKALVRGARFLVLAVDSFQGPLSVVAPNLHSGWDW